MSEGLSRKDEGFLRKGKGFSSLPFRRTNPQTFLRTSSPVGLGPFCTLVYSNTNKDAASLVGSTAHAIHTMASSLAFTGQTEIDKILKNCSWKNHTTFSEFHLKDLTLVYDDLHSLGPIVAAQKVVVP